MFMVFIIWLSMSEVSVKLKFIFLVNFFQGHINVCVNNIYTTVYTSIRLSDKYLSLIKISY